MALFDQEKKKNEVVYGNPTGGGGRYVMNRLMDTQGVAKQKPQPGPTMGMTSQVHNRQQHLDNIDTRMEARKGLRSPISLASQEFPRQDLTEARHSVPFNPDSSPNGFSGNFRYGMNPPGGKTFDQVSQESSGLPPSELVGRSLGNAARAVRGAVGIAPNSPDSSQRFPSNLGAAVDAVPQARPELSVPALGQQVHNKQRPLDNIAARRAGIIPEAPTAPQEQSSLSYRAGKFVRENLAPAVDSAVRGAAGVATLVPRAIYHVGDDMVRGFSGDAPNIEEFQAMPFDRPLIGRGGGGVANAAEPPQAVALRQSFSSPESRVTVPPPSQFETLRPDRALDAETYGDQAKIVGGNSPQAMSALQSRAERAAGGVGITPNLSSRDLQLKDNMGRIDQMLASGVQPTEHQAGAIAQLRRDAGFLRGGTDRYVAGPDGRPVRGGGGGNYSFQGSPEMASRFTNAVAPGEYSPEAVAARGQQSEQFLSRNGYEKVDPNSGLTQSELRRMPVIERAKVADAIAARANDRIKAEADRTQAQGVVDVGKGNLAVNQAEQATKAKSTGLDMAAKQMGIDEQRRIQGLQKQYNEAETTEERAIAERALIAAGALKRDKPEVFFDQEFDQMGNTTRKTPYILENGNVRSAVPDGVNDAPVLPQEPKKRVKGQVYSNGRGGYARWDGSGLVAL
jgi:hypothetical protein